jgi:hypothetical protein
LLKTEVGGRNWREIFFSEGGDGGASGFKKGRVWSGGKTSDKARYRAGVGEWKNVHRYLPTYIRQEA